MTVLVTVASRHQATLEIGQAIGRALAASGIPTDVVPAEEIDAVTPYEAVIIGSGVYAGNWLAPARDLIARCAMQLRERPVWLFSSGPMGDPPVPAGEPAGVAALKELIGPRGHRVFPGRLASGDLGFGEKLIVKAVRAPFGDYRDWPAIDAWAVEIAATLRPAGVPEPSNPVPVGAATPGGR
ncbi:MAG TPA: flavodoxin domain-containing protein [Candidatus Limnocylindrales bacterium]|nr:flavodoxin domain-containing protein [Candidatus Limnocylindrales bacterium]